MTTLTTTQLTLVRLLGKKDLSDGCIIHRTKYWEVNGVKGAEPRIGKIGTVYEDPNGDFTSYGVFWSDQGTYATTEFANYILNDKHEDGSKKYEILGHIPTLSDLHRWLNDNYDTNWYQNHGEIAYQDASTTGEYPWELAAEYKTDYDSSKDLIDQSEETLQAIINLVKSYER